MGQASARARHWPTRATALAVVVVLVAGIVSALTVKPRYPNEWDPRVATLADYVARERGMDYQHPVYVDFLDEDAFRQQVTSSGADLTEADRSTLERGAALLRATGLATGNLDLLDSTNEISGQSTLAYYDPADERITVRGTELSIGVRSTLVHELTHVLQDQYFDLERLGTFASDGENSAFQAVVEGDALRVEDAWAAQLGRTDRQALDDERVGDATEVNLPDDVPGALVALFSAPYVLGRPFVDAVFEERASQGIDDALTTPPRSEEQLLDPFAYLGNDPPQVVDLPPLADGETLQEEGDFGSLTWFLLLAGQLDARQALRATDGWGGDAYRAFERAGRTCIRAAFRGDEPVETNEMEDVLRAWTATVPANDASVSRRDDDVVLESCDPGPDAAPALGGGTDNVLVYPVSRTYLTLGALSGGIDADLARCIGTEFVLAYDLQQLLAFDQILSDPAALAQQSQQAALACG